MKGRTIAAFIVAVIVFCSALTGCFGDFFRDCSGGDTPREYTVQYTDDEGTHTIVVTGGEPYQMEKVPSKTGYEFLGLFDAATGGKQYVSAQGASLSVYNDKKNVVLFPHWRAKSYNVVLDYQGAEVTSGRSFTVNYDSSLPQLPTDLQLEHKEFCGWYTRENCQGVQVADKFGLVPVVSVVNADNFDLSQDGATINLYAGFTTAKYSVTLNFGSGLGSETMKAAYGTNIKNVVYNTRNENGYAVLKWSASAGNASDLFTGEISGDITLYAVEWAPAIEFDTDGGDKLAPVVAHAGANISLPVPTKSLYKFLRWEDKNGNDATNLSQMPSVNTTLKAVWQAKIVFDSNGGDSVDDITGTVNMLFTLPTATREGYVFAGWYTADKELYTSRKMPAVGILLKAGWYKEERKSVTLVENNWDKKVTDDTNTLSAKRRLKIDLTKELPEIPEQGVDIRYEVTFAWGNTYKYVLANAQLALYEGDEFHTDYELAKKSLYHDNQKDSMLYDSMSGAATIHKNVLYLYYAGKGQLQISLTGGYGNVVAFCDVKVNIAYADTSRLYL